MFTLDEIPAFLVFKKGVERDTASFVGSRSLETSKHTKSFTLGAMTKTGNPKRYTARPTRNLKNKASDVSL